MFCHKCGNKSIEGSAFCQKCGEKLIMDESSPQASVAPVTVHAPEPTITPTEETAWEPQQAPTNQSATSDKAGGGLHSVAKFGRVLLVLSLLLLFLSSFLNLSISPIILVVGVLIGIILSALNRPLGISKIWQLAVGGFVLVVIIAWASSGGNDRYVKMVKGGTLDGYPQKTVGRAFDDFLNNPKWESGLSEEGERFVNVKGGILYLDEKANIVVQFIIDKDNNRFSYNASKINGVPLNNFLWWGLLETIYDDGSIDD
jgi:hypothetical protein